MTPFTVFFLHLHVRGKKIMTAKSVSVCLGHKDDTLCIRNEQKNVVAIIADNNVLQKRAMYSNCWWLSYIYISHNCIYCTWDDYPNVSIRFRDHPRCLQWLDRAAQQQHQKSFCLQTCKCSSRESYRQVWHGCWSVRPLHDFGTAWQDSGWIRLVRKLMHQQRYEVTATVFCWTSTLIVSLN